jgi:phytanoyl-CoA dioxygenase PhyH
MTNPLNSKSLNVDISVEDFQSYDHNGVVVLRGVLSPQQISYLRDAVDQQLSESEHSPSAYDFQDLAAQMWRGEERFNVNGATRFDMDYYHSIVTADKKARPLIDDQIGEPCTPGKFFYDAAGWRHFEGIRKVALDSILPEAAAVLMNSTYINFWEDTTFIKTAGATQRTAFHQDKSYFQISGNKCCIMWIALDNVDESNGAMEYVRGSHKWGKEYAPNVFFAQTAFPDSDAGKLPDIEANRDQYDIVRIDVEPGDVIVHHVLTVHGAGGNRSTERDRRAISFRYCGDDIQYFDRPGAIPQHGLLSRLNNGDELYCADYPRVYPRPYPEARISDLYRLAD